MESPEIVQLSAEHLDKVFDFLIQDFFENEPISATIKLHKGSGLLHNMTMSFIKKEYIKKMLESGFSFGAFDNEGNVLGVKIGKLLEEGKIQK